MVDVELLRCLPIYLYSGSTDMKIGNVHVENCCSAPCKAILGQSTTFSFTFTLGKLKNSALFMHGGILEIKGVYIQC